MTSTLSNSEIFELSIKTFAGYSAKKSRISYNQSGFNHDRKNASIRESISRDSFDDFCVAGRFVKVADQQLHLQSHRAPLSITGRKVHPRRIYLHSVVQISKVVFDRFLVNIVFRKEDLRKVVNLGFRKAKEDRHSFKVICTQLIQWTLTRKQSSKVRLRHSESIGHFDHVQSSLFLLVSQQLCQARTNDRLLCTHITTPSR